MKGDRSTRKRLGDDLEQQSGVASKAPRSGDEFAQGRSSRLSRGSEQEEQAGVVAKASSSRDKSAQGRSSRLSRGSEQVEQAGVVAKASSSRPPSLQFRVEPMLANFGMLFNFQGLQRGIAMAKHIVLSNTYARCLLENVDDPRKMSLKDVKTLISDQFITISQIQIAKHMDAYALVYRKEDPGVIFLNPIMLLKFAVDEQETGSADLIHMHAVFLAVKLMHEFSHLIHPLISPLLVQSVKPRSEGGQGKKKMVTPEKSKDGAKFLDFGEMLEFDLVGGIVELYTTKSTAFSANRMILYPHPQAREGYLVRLPNQDLQLDDSLTALRLDTEDEPVDKPYRGPRGHLDVAINARFSLAGVGEEEDVIEDDEDEEEMEDMKEPTF